MWKEIGVVGVDSGQLLICDPCYIDSEWENEEVDYTEIIIFPNGKKERIKRCSKRWFELIDDINNKKVRHITEQKIKHNFSYNSCCQVSKRNGNNQLNYKKGHAGIGVCFPSGLGDGLYKVYAKMEEIKDWGERITEVKIKLI